MHATYGAPWLKTGMAHSARLDNLGKLLPHPASRELLCSPDDATSSDISNPVAEPNVLTVEELAAHQDDALDWCMLPLLAWRIARAQRAVYPPSTGSATPVTKLAPGLQSQSTEAAISSASPRRPMG